MTLYEFNVMKEDGQAKTLWELGVYLMVRHEREEGVFSEMLLMVGINEYLKNNHGEI